MVLKLCKDCKNFSEETDSAPLCMHSRSTKFDDLVYGNHTQRTCIEMRQDKTQCGTFGTLYAAKAGFIPMAIE